MQDWCMRISRARCSCQDLLSRTTCARSPYAGLLSEISLSGSLCQDPVVEDHLCKITVGGSLVQGVCVGMSVSGASRATCARSPYENFLCKMSVSESPQQNPVGGFVPDRCVRISCARRLSRSPQ